LVQSQCTTNAKAVILSRPVMAQQHGSAPTPQRRAARRVRTRRAVATVLATCIGINQPARSDAVAQTCVGLGWPFRRGNVDVCGISVVAGQCHKNSIGYDAAADACSSAGGRLCTAAELEQNVAAGSGCALDNSFVWTADGCGSGADGASFLVTRGSGGGAGICKRSSSGISGLRCCADAAIASVALSTSAAPEVVVILDPGLLNSEEPIRDYSSIGGCCRTTDGGAGDFTKFDISHPLVRTF